MEKIPLYALVSKQILKWNIQSLAKYQKINYTTVQEHQWIMTDVSASSF